MSMSNFGNFGERLTLRRVLSNVAMVTTTIMEFQTIRTYLTMIWHNGLYTISIFPIFVFRKYINYVHSLEKNNESKRSSC